MKVYWTDDYPKCYGVPGSCVVVAPDEKTARELLKPMLIKYVIGDGIATGLEDQKLVTKRHERSLSELESYTLHECDLSHAHVAQFESGDY